MPTVDIISKENGAIIETSNSNSIALKQNSVVKVNVSYVDVLNVRREGDNAVITLKNGEEIVIESYFDDPLNSHHIIFNDNGQLYWAEFTDAANEIATSIKYHPIDDMSALLVGGSSAQLTGMTPWLIAAGLATGVVIIADNMSSSGKKDNQNPEPPIEDPQALIEATAAVVAAEAAYAAAENALETAQSNGLITPAELAELTAARDAAIAAKNEAQDKVDALPANTSKDQLQDRLDDLVDITLPTVNDANDDGVADDLAAALADATAAVAAAELAFEKAEDALETAQSNGLITPAELAELTAVRNAAVIAKGQAETKVSALPAEVQVAKDALQDRLDKLVPITLPIVNDENDDGIVDDVAAALADATAAVIAAELAFEKAEDALTEAQSNGLITPAELANLIATRDAGVVAKGLAQIKVNALPAEVQVAKEALQVRLDKLVPITLPVVNDANDDGVDDATALADATAAVAAAELAFEKAEDELEAAQSNGLITPAELATLTAARDAAITAKGVAQTKVTALPAEAQAAKDALQVRLDKLVPITLPVVNDENDDGIVDDAEEALADATAAVIAAEAAYKAAEDTLAAAQSNGLITPAELAEVKVARDAAFISKAEAQAKVTALPASVQTAKDALQDRLDKLVPVTLPVVNDENGDGIVDDVAAALEDATAAVVAAELAYKAAEDTLAAAQANGLITPAELAGLTAARDVAVAAKGRAQLKVNALPADVQTAKDELQVRLDKLVAIDLPAVNDGNGDGVDDTAQALIDATKAVKAAEDAYKAAEEALDKAKSDDLITPTELADLTEARDAAIESKNDAQDKVDALPENTDKDQLQDRLDDLVEIILPTVNDENEDGVNDEYAAALADATAAVAAAELAFEKAEDALEAAQSNGLITPAELANLTALRDAAVIAKGQAETKVNALPAEVQVAKDALQDRLDKLVPITLPVVNDENDDGIVDDVAAALADATEAVIAAELAFEKAEDALTEAQLNGLITPAELATLTAARDAGVVAKGLAQIKVNALPAEVQVAKEALQVRLDKLVPITLPVVNDANDDGVDDAVALADATAAVVAAETAYAKAKADLEAAQENGLITPKELTDLTAARDAAIAAKGVAQTKVTALPAEAQAAKDALQVRLDKLVPITLPVVNDANDDGVDDAAAAIADATAAVVAAELAFEKAEDELAAAQSNGLITPAELATLTAARDAAIAAKGVAQTKVTALPAEAQAAKDALQVRLDKLVPITLPVVNDENDDGIVDDAAAALADATAAVIAAEAAYKAAEDTLTAAQSNGLITPAELAGLTAARDAAITAKGIAQAKVTALPEEVQTAKDALQVRLDKLVAIDLPAVNDANGDGVDDAAAALADATAAVVAAETAYAKAKADLEDALSNGLITPKELTDLTAARDAAIAAKTAAQSKVTALPAEAQVAKDALQDRLNKLVDITLPIVNDENDDGVDDVVFADIEAAVIAAELAYNALKAEIDLAEQDNVITADELADLTIARDAAIVAKGVAQTKVAALPVEAQVAKAGFQERLDKLVNIQLPNLTEGVFAAADNDVQLVLDIAPTVTINNDPSSLNSTGFTVGSLGLGPILNASVLESVFASSVQLSVAEGTTREVAFNADAGGVTVGTMNLFIYKLNETTGEWELQEALNNWYIVALGGISPIVERELGEGDWLFVLGNGLGLSLVTGYTLRFSEDKVNDFNNPQSVAGVINGNVISDIDYQNGQDIVPVGTKITAITNSEGITQILPTSGETVIKGKYGTLTIKQDGTFDYIVNADFRKYGEVDSFTYEVTAPNGDKTTAALNIELTRFASDEEAIIDNTVLLNVTPDSDVLTGDAITIQNANAINVIDLGLAGEVLSASVIGTEGVMNFEVKEGTTQNISFSGVAGGVTILTNYSFIIYRLNESNGQLEQIHEIPKFIEVTLLGGASGENITLSFGEGTYVGILKQNGGLNVLGGATARVDQVEIFDYTKPTAFSGNVSGDVTPDATDTLLEVNDQLFTPGQAVTVIGNYGTLVINANGSYTYVVTVPSNTATWKPPYGEVDRFEVVVQKADGKSVIEVLNIKLDTHIAGNDTNQVTVVSTNSSTLFEVADSSGSSSTREIEFKIEEGTFANSINLVGSRSLGLSAPQIDVEVMQVVNGVETLVYKGTAVSSGGNFTLNIERNDGSSFEAGDYKVNVISSSSLFNISAATITATVFNDISPVVTPAVVVGNIFVNDPAINQIDILKIGSKELYVNDQAKGGDQFAIQGKHGVLTLNKNGSYEYQASGESSGLETFTYTTISKAGSVQTATLEINVGMTLSGSSESETVHATASIESFTLGTGADTVVYDVLNQGLHQGQPDIWNDFNVAQGDKIDISALLQDQNVTSGTLGDYITVEKRGNDSVIKIDRDAQENKYNPTELIVLKNTDVTNLGLEDFLKFNQI